MSRNVSFALKKVQAGSSFSQAYQDVYNALVAQFGPNDPGVAELQEAYTSADGGDTAFIEFLASWLDNTSGDAFALGGVQAALQNHLSMRENEGGNHPQVLAMIISNKWGTSSTQWTNFENIRGFPNASAALEYLYYDWADNGYDYNWLQQALANPGNWIPFVAINPLGPDPLSPLPPPYGPPTPYGKKQPNNDNHLIWIIGGSLITLGVVYLVVVNV